MLKETPEELLGCRRAILDALEPLVGKKDAG